MAKQEGQYPILIMDGIIRREKISIIRRENESRRPSGVCV